MPPGPAGAPGPDDLSGLDVFRLGTQLLPRAFAGGRFVRPSGRRTGPVREEELSYEGENSAGQAAVTGTAVQEMRRVNGLSLDRIRNAVEVLACRMLEQKLKNCPEIDQSPESIEDMYCLALNRVPSLYYHSASSFARRLDDQGPPTDILAALDDAIDHAIMKVGEYPSRERER